MDFSVGFGTPRTGFPSGANAFSPKYKGFDPSYSGSKFGAQEFLSAFSSGLKSQDENKYRDWGSSQSFPFMIKGSEGGGGQILENLGVVFPQQQGPMFIPGQEGKKSKWGALGGALLGAATGFIPGVGLAGAALGSQLGGGLGGSLFDD